MEETSHDDDVYEVILATIIMDSEEDKGLINNVLYQISKFNEEPFDDLTRTDMVEKPLEGE